MSVWTEFEGSISFHDSEHISVKKVFDECFSGLEVLGDVKMRKGEQYIYFDIWCNIEESLEDALKLFQNFIDNIQARCKYQKLMRVDVNVIGRIYK